MQGEVKVIRDGDKTLTGREGFFFSSSRDRCWDKVATCP